MSFFSKILGDPNQKVLDGLWPLVNQINKLEPKFESFSNEQIKDETLKLKDKLKNGKTLDDILAEAFALAREAGKRTLNQRHYDVQLLGGIVLHQGQIAEMRTGEGKTLAATLPLYLNALSGKGAHLVTVNDYLARRDAVWMGQIYYALGLTTGCIMHEAAYIYDPEYGGENPKSQIPNPKQIQNLKSQIQKPLSHQSVDNTQDPDERDKERDELGSFKIADEFLRPVSRQEAYLADIVYGTNNEFGFDYLRDNMVQNLEEMAQRELNYAIVDEIDSILIDEARTPLIISGQAEDSAEKYYKFAKLAANLKENTDYNVDEKMRAATFTEEGQNRIVKILNFDPWAENDVISVHQLEAALKAKALFRKEKEYVVKNGEVMIVDEFTGRLMPGRRYSEGLHQAIEAKEGVEIKRESVTLATITFQNYFRMYSKLSGMTGTAVTSAEEFHKVYNLETVVVPTNKSTIRRDLPDRIYKNEEGKFMAIIREVKERNAQGQPILIGTVSIEKNELLGDFLAREGVNCNILNAKNHEREGEIIAQAGKPGAVTIATNMAGRGVDIVLGGNPSDLADQQKVIAAGGLHVLGTERHEARRIDNQLRGRAGRQGDPGSSQFFVSMDDDLMRIFGSDRMKGIMNSLGVPDDMPVENRLISKSIEKSQEKVEGYNFDLRKHLLEYDDVINRHRETIYKRRKKILEWSRTNFTKLRDEILDMVAKEISQVVNSHLADEDKRKWNMEEVYQTVGTIFPLAISQKDFLEKIGKGDDYNSCQKVADYLVSLAEDTYKNLEKEVGDEKLMRQIEKSMILRSIDMLWIEHLEAIDYLKTGIGLRGYGQREPLVEFKKESFGLFNHLLDSIQNQVVYSIYKVSVAEKMAPGVMEKAAQAMRFEAPDKTMEKGKGQFRDNFMPDSSNRPTSASLHELEKKIGAVIYSGQGKNNKKVGRNDPCPCGATKPDGTPIKYKHCCGRNV